MQEYFRNVKENYGSSTVELVEVEMSNENLTCLNIDGIKVLLPVLNLREYDSNCRCYAFIERLKNEKITMVDLLYTYYELPFDNKNFREKFLREYTRTNINLFTMRSPGIIVNPNNSSDKESFSNAIKLAIQASVGNKVFMGNSEAKESTQVEEKIQSPQPNSLVLQFLRSLYESMGGKLGKKDNHKIKNIDYFLSKSIIFIKSGEVITDGIQTGKYLTSFITKSLKTENSLDVEENLIKDMMSVYITGIDDYLLSSNPSYCERIRDIILSSNILEALYFVNPKKLPRFAYAGKIDFEKKLLTVNLGIEKYFNNINELLFNFRDKSI